jgi:hypothetical protein
VGAGESNPRVSLSPVGCKALVVRRGTPGAAALLACASVWLAPRVAAAEGEDEPSSAGEREAEHGHFDHAIVLKMAHVEARRLGRVRETSETEDAGEAGELEEPAFERHSALGVSYEHVLVEGWLSVELGTLLSSAPGGHLDFPSTLLLELPVELSAAVEGYLGAGVLIELEREKRWAPLWGAAVAAGLKLWIAPETGFNMSVERSVLFAEELVLELVLGLGVVARF